jgi:hypothetical protein
VNQRRPDAHRVVFLGGPHWPLDAEGVLRLAREVWPLVRQRVLGTILTIIGENPPAQLDHNASGITNCEPTGYVGDLQSRLAETAVFMVPLHAGGRMRVKIPDAQCWGLPVTTSSFGAEGSRIQDGENALLADTADAPVWCGCCWNRN